MNLSLPEFSAEQIARFESLVDRRGPDECWPWRGREGEDYGRVKFGNQSFRAHRVAFALAIEDPGDLQICHTCDNPPCCNPAHLFAGTQAENVADMNEKGRGNPYPGIEVNKKLSPEAVRAIRDDLDSCSALARRFGVSKQTISSVRTGRTYAEVV